jgi:hypothetical protein
LVDGHLINFDACGSPRIERLEVGVEEVVDVENQSFES